MFDFLKILCNAKFILYYASKLPRKEEEVCKKTESQKHTLLKAQVSLFQFLQPQSFNTDIRNSEELRKQYFTVMEKQSLHPPTCSRRVVLKAPKSYHSYEATRLCLQGL
eukprot:GHVP01058749.1.p1 GENE.GHVP01058749.1~~GHVP01058749.1.p1  ORF type:complete len:109 (+),score=13.20 GHVP01058749.1:306-632(+)